jgi:uncharacterized SAM-binding protein YcdF (DUF218 family)
MLKRLFKRRMVRRIMRAFTILLLVWMLLCVALAGVVFAYSRSDGAQQADVIVVLGAGLRRDGRPGPAIVRRGERAAQLYAEGYATVILCSGGFAINQTRSEADACREVLLENGVPEAAILLEDRSRSTEENALYTSELMQTNGWDTLLVVSDGYHLLRTQWIFSRQGLSIYTSPAADPPLINHLFSIGREVVALHWQLFKTLFNLPVTFVPYL